MGSSQTSILRALVKKGSEDDNEADDGVAETLTRRDLQLHRVVGLLDLLLHHLVVVLQARLVLRGARLRVHGQEKYDDPK